MELEIRRFERADEVRTFEHDSWVVGDELYVSLHVTGAEDYADE